MSKKWYWMLVVAFLATQMAFTVGCADDSDDDDAAEEGAVATVMENLAGYVDGETKPVMSADAVETALSEDADSYQLIDVRPKDHFDGGHVEGSINIPYGPDWALAETLAELNRDKTIVIVCHTGHKASFLTLYLVQLGYDAYAMKFGMMGWTTDLGAIGKEKTFCSDGGGVFDSNAEAVETETFELPEITSEATGDELVIELAGAYWNGDRGASPVIGSGDVNTAVVEEDDTYQIVDIRSAEDYDKAHIPGAINVPYGSFVDADALAPIDPSKTIVVVCYTGHTASQITMLLNEIGYDAFSMAYGMMGWHPDNEGSPCDDVTDKPVVTTP